MKERKLCKHCNRIYTTNDLCWHCSPVDPDKTYPSMISAVYLEGGIHQKLATLAFNFLANAIAEEEEQEEPQLIRSIAEELEATEDEVLAALEDLYTEN